MRIRTAHADDAEGACEVLRRSIKELCVADHGDDLQSIEGWLSNKTPENVRSWIAAPTQRLLVAEKDGRIVGIGGATEAGEITLNYVSPDARFQGVSKAILAALEGYLREKGQKRSTLSSTLTAHQFYCTAGYENAGEPQAWGKLRSQPMAKTL
ncbi:MAG: GNAT family N-acetyltransferase [Rhizobiaceae bacterium]|nr:GNAT family N-acetyltransferase [Rhizobiaceae bacterium]